MRAAETCPSRYWSVRQAGAIVERGRNCPRCERLTRVTARYCPRCGSGLDAEVVSVFPQGLECPRCSVMYPFQLLPSSLDVPHCTQCGSEMRTGKDTVFWTPVHKPEVTDKDSDGVDETLPAFDDDILPASDRVGVEDSPASFSSPARKRRGRPRTDDDLAGPVRRTGRLNEGERSEGHKRPFRRSAGINDAGDASSSAAGSSEAAVETGRSEGDPPASSPSKTTR